MKLTKNRLKEIIREEIQKLGGEHLLNEENSAAKKTATQIKSAARGSETGIFPLTKMAKNLYSGIRGSKDGGILKTRLKKGVDKYDWYVQTSELTGFIVFNPDPIWDGDIYEVWSDEGGNITAKLSKNWKSEIKKHG